MRYSGIQPQYFPRLHYFARILNSDIFVSRDDCQFLRKHKYPDGSTGKSYQAHTPIKTANGQFLLNVPSEHDGFKSISKTKVSNDSLWREDHLKAVKLSYIKTPYFKTVFPQLEIILNSEFKTIGELNLATIIWAISYLLEKNTDKAEDLNLDRINNFLEHQDKFRLKKIKRSMDMKSVHDLNKFENFTPNEKIITLIKEAGADEDFCGGTGVAAYLDHIQFDKNGIKVTVQNWKCKDYPQLFSKRQSFIPNLSIIDLLMNVSIEEALEHLSDE